MNTTPPARRSAGPVRYIVAAAVVAAIAVAGFFAFNGKSTVPDATFTLLSGQKVSTAGDLKEGLSRELLGDELRDLHAGNAADGRYL